MWYSSFVLFECLNLDFICFLCCSLMGKFIFFYRPTEDTKKAGASETRNLYEIPLMFEAREFLREKLMGKKVEVFLEHKVDTKNDQNTEIKRNYCMVKCGNM